MIGATEADVIRNYGKPTRSFDQGALRTLVYDRTNVEFLDTDTSRLARIPAYSGPSGPRTAVFGCTLFFTLEAGLVRSFDQRGGGCN